MMMTVGVKLQLDKGELLHKINHLIVYVIIGHCRSMIESMENHIVWGVRAYYDDCWSYT